MYIQNQNNINFRANLIKTTSIKLAEKHANINNISDEYIALRKQIKKLPKMELNICTLHNYSPQEGYRMIIGRKLPGGTKIKRLDYFIIGAKDKGKLAFETLKQLTNKESQLYKEVFKDY